MPHLFKLALNLNCFEGYTTTSPNGSFDLVGSRLLF